MISNNRHSAIESNNAFTAKVEDLVREIVIQNNILYYRIESSVEHLAKAEGEDNFMPVIRIITYFEDTVSQISDLLSTEFEIVAESSVDKKKSRIESFSYKHIQYLVGLKANRRELTEYKRSGDKKFEIQICSMLQDAWAGIEKELGYDSASFPEEGKRDLYRVGALLEMADLEFLKIRSKFISQPVVPQQKETIRETISEPEEAKVTATVYEAAPVMEVVPEPQPVAKIPEIVIDDFAIEEPVAEQREEIKETIAPVVEQPVVVAQVTVPEPVTEVIAPVQPAPAPMGLAPKRTRIDIAETIAKGISAVESVVERIISTPPSPVRNIIDEKAQEPAKVVIPEPEKIPEPVAKVIPPVVVPEVPKVEPEAVQPAAQQTFNIENMKVDNVENMKVNLNGNIEKEKVAEVKDVIGEEGSVPFFEDLLVEETPRAVKPAPLDENAPITDASLKEYVFKSKLLKEIDKQIAERAGARINPDVDIEGDVERLRFLKVYTLKQLHDRLKDNNTDIVAFAEKWIGKDNGGSFDSGISLFYLEYLLVGKKNDPAFAVEYVVKFISDNDYSARYIIPTYNSIRSTEAPNFSHLTLK